MKMDLNAIIEKMETGDQDAALTALQTFNKEKSQCFSFTPGEEEDREHLGELVLGFLERDLQPSCQLACLETIRILSRDKKSLVPFATHHAMQILIRHAGLGQGEGFTPEIPDLEVIVEALKCLCNIVFNSEVAQEAGAELQLIVGLAERLKQCREPQWNHYVRFFDLRLTFLITALRVDVRAQLACELRGVSLLSEALDATLSLCWPDMYEVARAGFDGCSELPPLGRQETERAMEILKILFNVTFDSNRRKVDEDTAGAPMYNNLTANRLHPLMLCFQGNKLKETLLPSLNLLTEMCCDTAGAPMYNNLTANHLHPLMLCFQGNKLKETLLPSLNLLTESARIHRETRKFLRMKVLPPLRDVKNRPEVGNALRNKLVRLMTHIDTDVKHCAAEFLFVLCKESVSRFIKYTGYGNAAGLLAARGLMRGGRDPGHYSEDEDSDTEEYREAKPHINPVTGRVEEEQPNPMEGMTEEQKEYEAMKLVKMFDKLSRGQVIQPMKIGADGKMTSLEPQELHYLASQQFGESNNSDSDSDTN
uniref:Synembryn n=1 Tax=Sinocyclocheilus grahami TaxID=75366 RepID=A0A672PLW1_SINGR